MRRPLKPFVTEYKSTARRPKDAFDLQPSPDGAAEPGADSMRHTENARYADNARNIPPPSDDSYEAAMRAADALFAAPAKSKPADAVPARPPAGASAAPSVAEPVERPVDAAPAPPERGSGRILQAIVEEPENPFAALEAEHAPKRRGRKPGSKNKPKVAPIAATPVAALSAADLDEEMSDDEILDDEVLESEFVHGSAPAKSKPKATRLVAQTPAVSAIPAIDGGQRGRAERFAWVRTSLRPGEKWKRRLPKVAW